jgi:NAD(P)-dependent dehydrogenase (short-subunit alcohol dehydrogenase family)
MADHPLVALVTGAAQGIGRGIALELGRRGYVVGLNDLVSPDDTLRQLEESGAAAFTLPGDVTDEAAVVSMVARVLAECGRIDVLVNNACVSFQRRAEDTTLDDWQRVLSVNLTGPFLLCREVGRAMLGQGQGSIVNVASIAGLFGIADRLAYNTSKHGLIGLTHTLAVEWGGRGIRVNAVCPGWVKTEMDVRDQARSGYTDADITHRVPMGRFAAPEDIAHAVAFLADPDQSGFINGQTLIVDGGWTADAGWESLRLAHR